MIDFQKELNEEQLKVIYGGDGPCLVLAGAGSGKTRTITYRVAYLLQQGAYPEQILLLTFTNKAAREMLERISALTGGRVSLPYAGTFHHIAYKLLKKYATFLNYKNNFTVLDSDDSVNLIKLCVKDEGPAKTEKKFPSPKVLNSIISFVKNSEDTVDNVLELKYPHFISFVEDIKRIYSEYEKRKREINAMDFDDLLLNLYLLFLKNSEVLDRYKQGFKYVLVDEYQDTNKIQDSIINLLGSHHKNILVVGDDAQSIYSFRAANVQNILDFPKKYADVKIFKLQTNYRSSPNILDLANDVIDKNTNQFRKVLKSIKEPEVTPELYSFMGQREEAEHIASEIKELLEQGVSPKEIAVLFRSTHHSQALELELNKRNIGYDYRGGVRFFERSHIKDVLCFLRIMENLGDAIAWHRILSMQTGIGVATANRILDMVSILNLEDVATLNLNLSARAQIGWNDFLSIWMNIINVQEKKPAKLIENILNTKYVDYLKSEYDNYRERLEDIKQMVEFAQNYEELSTFLAEAALQEGYAAKQIKEEKEKEKVVLSTIHQAKGLEWEAVFVLNLAAGQFPNDRALREEGGLEEERRLFYVAITRAKKYLCLTYSEAGGFGNVFSGPSGFIDEIDKKIINDERGRAINAWTDPSDDVDDVSYEPFEDEIPSRGFLKSIDEL